MLLRLGYDWLRRALTEALEGRQARWQALLDQSRQSIDRIVQLLDTLGARRYRSRQQGRPEAFEPMLLLSLSTLRAAASGPHLVCLRPRRVKDRTYFRDEITVDGQPADTPERLYMVCAHVDLALAFKALEVAWSDHRGLPSGSQSRIRVAAIKEHVAVLALL